MAGSFENCGETYETIHLYLENTMNAQAFVNEFSSLLIPPKRGANWNAKLILLRMWRATMRYGQWGHLRRLGLIWITTTTTAAATFN